MDKNKRWKEVTALFLISIAVFGVAEDSRGTEQTFNEMQEQMADVLAELAQMGMNSEEIAEQERESEDVSEQETENEEDTEVIFPLNEGISCVCRDGMYGFVDQRGETVIPFVYDDAAPLIEGLAYFRVGEEYGFMDKTGTPVFNLSCDSVSNFQDGHAYISVDGKYGYIDQSGEIAIQLIYDDADYFQDGYAVIMKNGKFGVIDQTGKEIIEPKYQEIDRGGENFVVQEDEKYQIVNRNGDSMLKNPCEEIDNYNDSVVSFRDEAQGICGYVMGEDIVYFEGDYDWMYFIPQRELVIVKKDETYGIKDFQENTVVEFKYQNIYFNESKETFIMTDSEGKERKITADYFTGKVDDAKWKQKDIRQEELLRELQYNKLTQRVSDYLEFLEDGTFYVEDVIGPGHETSLSEWGGYNITTRLYDFGQIGNPVLYLYGCPRDKRSGISYSGFFAIQGEEVVCLLSAYDGGGSGGGEWARLWYDREENRLLPGKSRHSGGGIFGASGEVFDLIDGECQSKVSFEAYERFPRYEGEEAIRSYYVNNEETTEEHYKEVDRRYLRVKITY